MRVAQHVAFCPLGPRSDKLQVEILFTLLPLFSLKVCKLISGPDMECNLLPTSLDSFPHGPLTLAGGLQHM